MFESWFNEILLPYAKKLDGLKVLICDNLSSHLSLNVIKLCQEHEILFVLLPPNSTHLCQPLDVAFFRPLKAAWRRVLDEWKIHNKGVIQKSAFPRLLKETFEKIGTSSKSNVISGFRKAGIVPLLPDSYTLPPTRPAHLLSKGQQRVMSTFRQLAWVVGCRERARHYRHH